jgi:malate dehydrogenase (oxaloacetate-decarboxylating)
VAFEGRSYPIAQCNNSYVFPAIGLGVLAGGCRRVSDEMLRAAARELGECSPARSDPNAPLLPPLTEIRGVTRRLARAVAAEAQRQGHADPTSPEALNAAIDREFWEPAYAD